MTDYDNLYLTLKPGLIKFYNISSYDIKVNPHTLKLLKCHAHLHYLLLIEMVLENHRYKYRTSIVDLSGIKALHHMVYNKTNWTPEVIRATPVHDLIFVLQEEMSPEYLPEEERMYLKTILNNDNPPKIDLASYAGWSIGEGYQYLRSDQ